MSARGPVSFSAALYAMREGKKVRRLSWPARWYIHARDGQIYFLGRGLIWTPSAARCVSLKDEAREDSDLLATDWTVLP